MSSTLSAAAAPAADADDYPSTFTYCYSLQAWVEPGVMPRVMELFAKRGLVPQKWHSSAAGSALAIDVQITGLDDDVADYIARCMRQITGVETVLTTTICRTG